MWHLIFIFSELIFIKWWVKFKVINLSFMRETMFFCYVRRISLWDTASAISSTDAKRKWEAWPMNGNRYDLLFRWWVWNGFNIWKLPVKDLIELIFAISCPAWCLYTLKNLLRSGWRYLSCMKIKAFCTMLMSSKTGGWVSMSLVHYMWIDNFQDSKDGWV